MKKFLTITLAIAMILTMGSISVFAATTNIDEVPGSDSADVKATYEAGSTASTVYSVDIEWGSLEFTYTAEKQGEWDPATHTYDGLEYAKWSTETGDNIIKVSNHSNTSVGVQAKYTKDSAYTGISGKFSAIGASGINTDTLTAIPLVSAVGKPANDPNSVSISLSLTGDLDSSVTTATKIGTVTITIS